MYANFKYHLILSVLTGVRRDRYISIAFANIVVLEERPETFMLCASTADYLFRTHSEAQLSHILSEITTAISTASLNQNDSVTRVICFRGIPIQPQVSLSMGQ